MSVEFVKKFCAILIFFGIGAKFYGITDPWKKNDHYNFGGIYTTAYAECLKSTPLAESKGVPHKRCWTNEPEYYRAHPPTLLFGFWGWTSVFGSAEWSYRLFILVFSTMNIGLIFLIGRQVRPGVFPWLAAAFQSTFLGNMYFGTHLDFIGEFTVFFVLLSSLFALKGRITTAGLLALVAGISAWPGYIAFGPLWAYTWLTGKGRKRIFAFGAFGFCLALATMMWLQQTYDIVEFFRVKLFSPGYIKKEEKGFLEPLRFASNFVSSNSRLLSPLFCVFAFMELIMGEGRAFFTGWRNRFRNLTPFHHAVLLSSGTGLIYALIGHEYFMVHVYLYLLFTPGLALLAARFVEKLFAGDIPASLRKWQVTLTIVGLLFAALYPYGIYKTNVVHDALTSVALIICVLALIAQTWRKKLNPNFVAGLIAFGAAANFSQLLNYRNEPDTERSFCIKAREEFGRTGQPVVTVEPRSDAKDLMYCKDVPIIYSSESTK